MVANAEQIEVTVMADESSQDYRRISEALAWLTEHYVEQPSLADCAEALGLSAYHFQRLFSRWVGLTPKKYIQYLTLQQAKTSLLNSRSVLDAAFAAGLSGPSRLHDLFVAAESMTPGEYKNAGAGLKLDYGFEQTPYGECCTAWCERGICAMVFTDDQPKRALEQIMQSLANAEWAQQATRPKFDLSSFFNGTRNLSKSTKLLLGGTAFEVKVWEALLRIPYGHVASYADIARHVGQPSAARAVGRAIGANRIAGLIPCHRVIRASGVISGYRWGSERKLAMLTREAARKDHTGLHATW